MRVASLVGMVVVVALPLTRSVQKTRTERTGADFLRRVFAAQEAYRNAGGRGSYASDLESLTSPCAVGTGEATLSPAALAELAAAGYQVRLRAAQGAETRGLDCHGHPTSADYYVGVQPASAARAAQQAFGATRSGRVFVFFDGVAPIEGDMRPGGLATPLEALETFKIP